MAEPSTNAELATMVSRLSERSFKTYKARLRAHERLVRRNNSWNASLIALATSTTVASVGLLVDKKMYGAGGDALMVVLAVLSLVASLVVSSVNYGSRARAMEASYKRIQQISLAAENMMNDGSAAAHRNYQEIQKEYDVAVESSENHTDADYYRSLTKEKRPPGAARALARDLAISMAPYVTLAVPILMFVPFVRWFINGL